MSELAKRISIVTLGVADVAASTSFYERLGWKKSIGASQPEISFITLGNIVLALFGRQALAEDAHLGFDPPRAGQFQGVTLAINMASEGQVDAALEAAGEAGATILKPAQKVFWGGYSGYFADPDGHAFEIAYNPFFPLSATGQVILPD